MILPQSKDAIHRGQLFRLLIAILENQFLASSLVFKGGTCAAMLGFLDRFSVDLDFDLYPNADKQRVKLELEQIFSKLELSIKDESVMYIQYHLRYDAPENVRNTLKLDIIGTVGVNDQNKVQLLSDIQRYANCQTIETMFAHKLIALLDRYKKNKKIAGRDVYDLYYFFLNGYKFDIQVLTERSTLEVKDYLNKCVEFLENVVTDDIISQDLNMLLDYKKFNLLRKSLRIELIAMLKDEIGRQG